MGVRLLIVDGVDGIGKTTLVEELERRTSYDLIKQPTAEGPLGFLRKEVKENKSYSIFERQLLHTISHVYDLASKFNGGNVIMDRCYLSGLVYGKVFGLTDDQRDLIRVINQSAHAEMLKFQEYNRVDLVVLTGEKRFNPPDNSIYEDPKRWETVRDLYQNAMIELQDSGRYLFSENETHHLVNVDGKSPSEVLKEVCEKVGLHE